MGTDIHMIAERKVTDGEWHPLPVPGRFQKRNYRFFAAIGDVRNGFGFAGCKTHTPIKPVQSGRGLPDDISQVAKDWFLNTDLESEEGIFGFPGEHSEGYATLAEIKEFEIPIVDVSGFVDEYTYQEWKDGGSEQPENWCGGIGGPGIIKVAESEYDKEKDYSVPVYIYATWQAKLLDKGLLYDLIEWMESCKTSSSYDVRVLFNFDS